MLDDIDCNILACLQENARIPFAELGRRVGLSTPAVIERVRRLEESGVIAGYHAEVRPEKVGLTVRAFIKVSVAGDKLEKFATIVKKVPEILECHRVTGSESFILQAAVEDVTHLELVIDSLMPYVATNTAIVLGSPVPWAPVIPRRNDRQTKK
jgi:Lrp/AsnC family leucine-responsive transcriptional regulator